MIDFSTADKLHQKKEVQNQDTRSTTKKNLYLTIIKYISNGLQPPAICKLENISKTALQYYLNKLKRAGAIYKIAYGTWAVSKEVLIELKRSTNSSQVGSPQSTPPSHLLPGEVRGHAFVFTLSIKKGLRNWEKRVQFLEAKNIAFKTLNIPGGGQRILFKGRKIWLTKESIVTYEKESYFAQTAKEAQDYAIYNYIALVKKLEKYLHADFTLGSQGKKYKFKVSRQHYALVKNALAKQYDIEGKKLNIYTENGLWFLIDNSFNLHEAETVHPETADSDSKKVQDFFNSLKDYPLTTDFVLSAMNGIQHNQQLFAQNMSSHVQAVQDLKAAVNALTATVCKVQPQSQRTLGEFKR